MVMTITSKLYKLGTVKQLNIGTVHKVLITNLLALPTRTLNFIFQNSGKLILYFIVQEGQLLQSFKLLEYNQHEL